MTRHAFLASVVLCLVFTGLSQVSDPALLGIHEEPARILYYAGSGLLAGVFGIIALAGGIYLGLTRYARISSGQRWIVSVVILLLFMAVLIFLTIRFDTG